MENLGFVFMEFNPEKILLQGKFVLKPVKNKVPYNGMV